MLAGHWRFKLIDPVIFVVPGSVPPVKLPSPVFTDLTPLCEPPPEAVREVAVY
jgi:hypothetical protein